VILVLLRAAEADIEEAFRWYEARRVGLGHDFVAEVDSAFERALEAPSSFPAAVFGASCSSDFRISSTSASTTKRCRCSVCSTDGVIAAGFDVGPSCRDRVAFRGCHACGPQEKPSTPRSPR
jgi:hypothetical protein